MIFFHSFLSTINTRIYVNALRGTLWRGMSAEYVVMCAFVILSASWRYVKERAANLTNIAHACILITCSRSYNAR